MRSGLFSFAVALLVVFASLLYVRSRFLLVELSYDLTQRKSEKAKLEQEKRALSLELATLKSPSRIEKIVKTELKLTKLQSAVPVVLVEGEP